MAFAYKNKKGVTYYLHNKERTGNAGQGRLFFFSKEAKGKDTLDEVPEGYQVVENQRTGLPLLKRNE